MQKNTKCKSAMTTIAIRVVLCLIFLAVGAVTFTVTAQTLGQDSVKYWKVDTVNDHFWEPHCPIMDGLNLYMLRQNLTLDGYQTILKSEMNLDNKSVNTIQFTNLLPFISKGNFHSNIGTEYSKYNVQSDNDGLSKSIQNVWLFTAWQYTFKRWDFTLITENYINSDESTLHAKTGNLFFPVLYLGYAFNKYWEILFLGGYSKQHLVGQIKEQPIIAIQGRYQPSGKLKMLFGVPTLFSAEWTALPKTDIGMKYDIFKESQLFVRQRISNKVGISVEYISSWNHNAGNVSDKYFNNTIYNPGNNNEVTYNRISNLQPQLFADVNFRISKDIGFSIGAGYNFSSKMSLYYNNDEVYDGLKSKDNFFINFSLQCLRLK